MSTIIQGHFPRSEKDAVKTKEKPASIYQFSISLTYSDPPIWRRFQVPGDFTLAQLHKVIKALMGWSGKEAHQFYVGKIFYTMPAMGRGVTENHRFDESKYTLHDLEESMKWCFIYLYDAGEGWEHELELEEILPVILGEKYPVILAGERAAPPESVEGIHAYEEYVSGRNVTENRNNTELHGVDTGFDPDLLDMERINGELKKMVQPIDT